MSYKGTRYEGSIAQTGSYPETLALYRMRVRGGSGRRRDALRASGKAVWAWPPVGAAGAGSMQIQ